MKRLLLIVFVAGLVAKLILIVNCAPSLLCLDEWDGLVSKTLVPWENHNLTYSSFVTPYNQHRMLWDKIWQITCETVTGGFNNQRQCVLNAVLHCAIITAFAAMLIKLVGKWKWAIAGSCILIMALPFASENTLCGYQSQVYWMLGFTFAASWFLVQGHYVAGLWLCFASIFTLASGFAIAAAWIPVLFFTKPRPKAWVFTWLAVITAYGLWLATLPSYLSYPEAYAKEPAENVWSFIVSTARGLAWPCMLYPWAAVFILAPFALLRTDSKASRFILAILAWIILQSLATGYARGTGGRITLPRYQDYFCLLLPLSVAALAIGSERFKPYVAVPWAIAVLAGLVTLTVYDLRSDLPNRVKFEHMWDENTMALYTTGNAALFNGYPSYVLPWPKGAASFNALIHQPEVRKMIFTNWNPR